MCLVTFGDPEDESMHPTPDLLLLAFGAANIWGRLTDQRLLANETVPDPYDDMSLGDIIAETAYCMAHFAHPMQATGRENLAHGLGQPNGYVPS